LAVVEGLDKPVRVLAMPRGENTGTMLVKIADRRA
jgi:hypothetical protein